MKPKSMVFVPLLLALSLAIACGAAATPTPALPAATKAPAPIAAAPVAPAAPAAAAATATPVPTAAPRPTPAPTVAAKPRVDRLKIAIEPLPYDSNVPREATSSAFLPLRPFMEFLVDVDMKTGQFVPQLATKWEASSDFKTWTFHLRKNVSWHFGYGQFTSKDVLHSLEHILTKESTHSDTEVWKTLVGENAAAQVMLPNDHQVVFNLKRPNLDMAVWQVTPYRTLAMMSKTQWDKEGIEGVRKRPTGTGPYQFKERPPGQYMLLERVENHWRHTPEFKEIQMFFPPEDTTRLAMLLAGEAHIADFPRSLQKQALAKGKKLIPSVIPLVFAQYAMGGLFFDTPELDPTLPWTNIKVREALVRAVDKKEIQRTIFEGKGEPMINHYYLPSLPGWNPEWEKQYEAMYAYDPEKAKRLLVEAGYPQGFKVTIVATVLPGLPEMPQLSEVLGLYLNRIGLKTEIVNMEFSKLRDLYRVRKTHGMMWGLRGTWRPIDENIRIYNYSKGKTVHTYVDKFIDQKYDAYIASIDPAEREKLLREVGDYKFKNYDHIPVVWLYVEIGVDPSVVAEYNYGRITGVYTHLEYIKSVR
jgi:ABC-type transport system substrate-binding protein